eukprot:1614144-Lingulodinium_polyedra.AAC.1
MTDWRARLVPAAAVIPAPIAYISVVAVKTSVVELKARNASDARSYWGDHPQGVACVALRRYRPMLP